MQRRNNKQTRLVGISGAVAVVSYDCTGSGWSSCGWISSCFCPSVSFCIGIEMGVSVGTLWQLVAALEDQWKYFLLDLSLNLLLFGQLAASNRFNHNWLTRLSSYMGFLLASSPSLRHRSIVLSILTVSFC